MNLTNKFAIIITVFWLGMFVIDIVTILSGNKIPSMMFGDNSWLYVPIELIVGSYCLWLVLKNYKKEKAQQNGRNES